MIILSPLFSNFFGLKSGFEKLRFCDRLVWTVGPNDRNKAAFSNFSSSVWTLPEVTGDRILISMHLCKHIHEVLQGIYFDKTRKICEKGPSKMQSGSASIIARFSNRTARTSCAFQVFTQQQ